MYRYGYGYGNILHLFIYVQNLAQKVGSGYTPTLFFFLR